MDRAARILIVEDEGLVALDLQDRLIKAGYDVPEIATSSEEALRVTASLSPDLVLMDIRLRGPQDGIETAREISASASIPIIFLTANADAVTIQRARTSRPAAFFVKPIPFASLTSSIEMALYRSRADRYSAFLVGLQTDRIVLITDLNGNIEFVSPAWLRLTGFSEVDVLGSPLSSFVSFPSSEDEDSASDILRKLETQQSAEIPRGSWLSIPGGSLRITLAGQCTLRQFGDDSPKAVWHLQDVSSSEWDERQILSERKTLAKGHLAQGIGETVDRLFYVISELRKSNANSSELERACQAGMGIARQLTSAGEGLSERTEPVDVNDWIGTNDTLLSKLLGKDITVCFDLCAEPALVRLPVHSVGQVLLGVVGSLRHRLAGPGTVQLKTHLVGGWREHVRLEFRLARSGPAAWTPFVFPFGSESSDLEVSVASALVTAAEGRLRYRQSWANTAQIEILLPSHRATSAQTIPAPKVVLLIGPATAAAAALEKHFEREGCQVIRSWSEAEALIVAQIHLAEISTVLADLDTVSPNGRKSLELAFLARNPDTQFIWRTSDCKSLTVPPRRWKRTA